MRNPFRRHKPQPASLLQGFPALQALLEGVAQADDAGRPRVEFITGGEMPEGRTLSEILGAGRPARSEEETRAQLLAFATSYGRCPFRVGQWVTRREGSHGHGQGWPHLVVEVAATPHRNFYVDSRATPDRDPDYGARYDMRVLHANKGGEVHAHWVESWLFEAVPDFAEVPQPEDGPDVMAAVVPVPAGGERDPRDERLEAWAQGKGNVTIRMPDGETTEPGHPVTYGLGHALAVSECHLLTRGLASVPWRGPQTVDSPVFFDAQTATFNSEGTGLPIPKWRLHEAHVSYPIIEVR